MIRIIDDGAHAKETTRFEYISFECNAFFKDSGLMVAPWPENCKIFKYDECSSYEISRDGKSIDSCELISQKPELKDTGCNPNKLVNKCEEFYEGKFVGETEDGEQLRFPDTGA